MTGNEPTHDGMDESLIKKAADVLDIRAVFMNQSSIRVKDGFFPQFSENSELRLTPQYRAGPIGHYSVVSVSQDDDSFKAIVFFFAAGVRLVDSRKLNAQDNRLEDEADAVYAEITATFGVQYRFEEILNANDLGDAFKEFGRFNVGYHAWPYWREYVQSTSARIGIPPIPVPMFLLPKFKKKTKRASRTKAETQK